MNAIILLIQIASDVEMTFICKMISTLEASVLELSRPSYGDLYRELSSKKCEKCSVPEKDDEMLHKLIHKLP